MIGFLVKLAGVYYFRRPRNNTTSFSYSKSKSFFRSDNFDARSSNMQLVFLHMASDLGGSIGIAISSWLVGDHGLQIADPIISIIIALLIFYGCVRRY